MVALVPVVLGDGHAGVDRRLPGGHRHIGGVGDEDGAVHQGLVALGVQQLGELLQGLGHLIAPLAAAQVDDDVGVRPLGQLVLGHGLARAEGAGDGGSAPLADGEEGVDDALPGDEGPVDGQALGHGTGGADGPALRELEGVDPALLVGELHQGVLHGVLPAGGRLCHRAAHPRGEDAAVEDEGGLRTLGIERAGGENVPLLDRDGHIPFLLQVQGGEVEAPADEGAALLLDDPEGAGDAVKDIGEQARPQENGHGLALGDHGLPGGEAGGVLVDLDGGQVGLDPHHLADEALVPHSYHVHHGQAPAPLDGDHRAVDAVNSVIRLIHTHNVLFGESELFLLQLVGEGEAEQLGKVPVQLGQGGVEGGVQVEPQLQRLGDEATQGE